MKHRDFIILIIALGINFTACGNSNKATENETVAGISTTEESDSIEKIAIDTKCTTPATIDSYIELIKGDDIVKEEANTTIAIFHDENNNKRACLEFGEAYIEREKES